MSLSLPDVSRKGFDGRNAVTHRLFAAADLGFTDRRWKE